MKRERNVAVHVSQVPKRSPTTVSRHSDFRGQTIVHRAKGFHYHGEVCIDKDPQAQAIRSKAKGLLFVQKSGIAHGCSRPR